MSKARILADFISTGVGTGVLADGAISVSEISDLTATAAELNNVAGINTSVQAQLDGKQAVVAGVSSTEIGYLDGVTSALQTQLDNISVTSGSLTKSFTSGETASITLAQAISPAPVVSATKEVPQAGISSKGTWDVNATASNYELHNTAYDTTLTPASLGYQISSASYDSKSFNTTKNSNDLAFKDDGTKVYYVGNNNYMWQRTLSTAWDISTAGSATSFDQSSQDSDPRDVTFKTDGTKMYLNGDSNNRVFQYSLSTAWDITTATYDNKSHLTTNQTSSPFSTEFKSDGTKMYITGGGAMYEYSLSTAWDVSTASYTSNSFTFTSQDTYMRGIFLKPDGTKLYAVGNDNDSVFEYTFGTAWDLSTLSYSGTSYALPNGTNPTGIAFSTDGTKLYNTDFSNALIYQYSTGSLALVLGTGSFASTDVGKRIQGNGGDVTLTSTAGAYVTTGGSAFTDSSTIASGSWSMRGLKSAGDADGIGLSGYATDSFTFGTFTKSHNVASPADTPINLAANSNGTKWFVYNQTGTTIYEFLTSTPGDIRTATYTMSHAVTGSWVTSSPSALTAAGDGSRFYMTGSNGGHVYVATTGNGSVNGIGGWSPYQIIPNTDNSSSIQWKPDGSKLYIKGINAVSNPSPSGMTYAGTGCYIYAYDVPTAWDITSINNPLNSATSTFFPRYNQYSPFAITDNGTRVVIGNYNDSTFYVYKLSTAWDVTSVDYSTEIIHDNSTENTSGGSTEGAIGMTYVNDKLYTISYNIKKITEWPWGNTYSYSQPTSQYHVAVTNSGGQIDTSTWLDLNTMVADQSAGDGTVHYAVSTDDRTTWSVIKEGSGVRPIVRDNSGTWQYNTAVTTVGGSVASASYDSVSAQFAANQNAYEVHWGDGGNLLFVQDSAGNQVVKYTASTPYNVTTLTQSQTYSFAGQEIYETTFYISPDGLHFYIAGSQNPGVHEYSLSTAYDLTTVSYVGKYLLAGGTAGTISFKPDGSRIYVGYYNGSVINTWPLTTAWDTSSYGTMQSLTPTETTRSTAIQFNADGTKMFVMDTSVDKIFRFNLSTAYDITTAAKDEEFLYSAQTTQAQGFAFNNDFTKINISGSISGSYSTIYQYSSTQSSYTTSTTWANSTTNDEFYALQEALGETEFNRMDKTQLDAVTDPNHYTLGDTLDLAIALRMDTASASSPTADGVTINYDAASLNQGAVLGTDYDYDFPNSTTVRVTSNAAQNLKIRVV
jgi:hypothetical protein